MKKIINNLLYIIIILFPIIDVLSSFNIRYNLNLHSPGILIRGLFLIYTIIYTVYNKKINYNSKRKIIIYYITSIIFFTIFGITRIKSNISYLSFIEELKILFKFFYFPVTLIFLKNYDINKKKLFTSLNISTIFYSLFIIIPLFTNTHFNSYSSDYKGIVGWFYSANEIGSLLSINLILLYLNIDNKNSLFHIFLIILNIFCLSLIGTKVSLLSIMIISTVMFFIFLFTNKTKSKKAFTTLLILILSILFITLNNTSYDILKRVYPNEETVFKEYNNNYMSLLLSNRDSILTHTYNDYNNSNITYKLFGLGFTKDNKLKSIEMDMFDILLRYGIIGFIIYFTPLLHYIIKFIKKKIRLTSNNLICILGITLSLLIAFVSGHVLSAPSVSIYISICMSLIKE